MKKITLAVLAAFVCASFASAQPARPEGKPEMKKEAPQAKQDKKEQGEKKEHDGKKGEKLNTLTGVITAVDAAAGTITAESVRVKGEVMTFSYAGVAFKNGDKEVGGETLKVGDKIKLKYEGDIKAPAVKKAMLMTDEGKDGEKGGKKEKEGKKEKGGKKEGKGKKK